MLSWKFRREINIKFTLLRNSRQKSILFQYSIAQKHRPPRSKREGNPRTKKNGKVESQRQKVPLGTIRKFNKKKKIHLLVLFFKKRKRKNWKKKDGKIKKREKFVWKVRDAKIEGKRRRTSASFSPSVPQQNKKPCLRFYRCTKKDGVASERNTKPCVFLLCSGEFLRKEAWTGPELPKVKEDLTFCLDINGTALTPRGLNVAESEG